MSKSVYANTIIEYNNITRIHWDLVTEFTFLAYLETFRNPDVNGLINKYYSNILYSPIYYYIKC
jgi:hypothetical protein